MSTYNSANITVNVDNFQQAYTDLGIGAIPAGTTIANGIKEIEKALIAKLMSGWPANGYPASDPNQRNEGIMEPWSDNVAGTAPFCVTQQLTSSFNGWQLPYSSGLVNQIAIEITQNIASNGGQTGTFYGQTSLTPNETIYWGVAFTTAVVTAPPSNSTGIIYAFTAVLDLN